ncbi:hypothetical protein FACS1894187_02670 [Synergistales bacterium]|nr:hypothetical protein FACS1894187_02670 [Synergistales bacterium]
MDTEKILVKSIPIGDTEINVTPTELERYVDDQVFLDNAAYTKLYNEAIAGYRKRFGLLSPKDIRDIREAYGLSQKDYSLSIGIGEASIQRYERGTLQPPKCDHLFRLSTDPDEFRKLVLHNAPKLERESKNKVNEVQEKINAASANVQSALRSLNAVGETVKFSAMLAHLLILLSCKTPLVALNKLLFYCDFLHCKRYASAISWLPYVHLQNGPVVSGNKSYALFDEIEDKKIIVVDDDEQGDWEGRWFSAGKKAKEAAEFLSEDEKETVADVVKILGSKTGNELSRLSHQEDGYIETAPKKVISYHYAETLKYVS